MNSLFLHNLAEQVALLQSLQPLDAAVAQAGALATQSLRAGGKLMFCGNGGSAGDAQHFAAEFVGRFERERPGLAALSMSTDTSILTAIGNDYAFDQIYAKQVQALGQPGDVLLAISTSGNSANGTMLG